MSGHSVEAMSEMLFGVHLKNIHMIVPANRNPGVGVVDVIQDRF